VDAVDTSPDLGDQNGLKTFEMAIRRERRPDDTNGTRERFLSLDLFSLTFKNIFSSPLTVGGRLGQSPSSPPWIHHCLLFTVVAAPTESVGACFLMTALTFSQSFVVIWQLEGWITQSGK